jgi:hypothetical protein
MSLTPEQQDYADAALAAGYEIEFEGSNAWIDGDYRAVVSTSPWLPRYSDLHSFRLMVDAEITIDRNADGIEASFEAEFYSGWAEWEEYGDKYSATRAAIWKAAVAKGKAMREAKP